MGATAPVGKGRFVNSPSIRTYRDKMRQANKEARATVVALICIIAVWLIGGFGLAGCDLELFHTPIWIIGGCVAPWIAAIIAAVVLSRRVFVDFDLDDDPARAANTDASFEEGARHE